MAPHHHTATENLLGNGKLTVAARISSVVATLILPFALAVVGYFGAHALDELHRVSRDVSEIKATLVGVQTHAVDQDKDIDRLNGKVFK